MPRRKEHRCGSRGCVTCGERWAARNFVVINERLQLLATSTGREALKVPLMRDAEAAMVRAEEAQAIMRDGEASAETQRAAASMLRSAKNVLTRRQRALWLVDGWEETQGRIVNLTHRDTMFPADASSEVKRAALVHDLNRISERLRRLTLDDEWRDRACGWVAKLEMTYNAHDDGTASWHVHAHCIVWGRDYWPQAQLQDLWERHRAAGEAETDGVSVYIAAPKRGLADVVKYATKAITLSEHDANTVGAAFVLATHGRRLLRLGGALNGLQLVDEEEEETQEELMPDDDTESDDGDATGSTAIRPMLDGAPSRLRTMSGRWVTDDNRGEWRAGPAWEEKVRAVREYVWIGWRVRCKNQGVEPYAPAWLQ